MFTIEGATEDNIALEPLKGKFHAFNWHVLELDGHDVDALLKAFDEKTPKHKPKMIIAKTTKGRGIPSVEGKASSHFFRIKPEDADEALRLLKSS